MGAGVAGLQAIATARRLGAIVTATDVRPAAKEQVESLGAKFIAVEDEEFKAAETAGGYAKEMSKEYQAKQAALVAEHIKKQDIVITTALIPGRPAPRLISKDMVASMRPGSVIVDLAVERGGNVEGVSADDGGEVRRRQDRRLSQRAGPARRHGVEPLRQEPLRVPGNPDRQEDQGAGGQLGRRHRQGDGADPRRRDRASEFQAEERGVIFYPSPLWGGTASEAKPRVGKSSPQRLPLPHPCPSPQGGGERRTACNDHSLVLAQLDLATMRAARRHAASDVVDPFVFRLSIFVLAVFVGYYVVWSVTPALHTPLMSVTNAISSVIVVGALLAVGVALVANDSGPIWARALGFVALTFASVNIFGGFLVTQRMLGDVPEEKEMNADMRSAHYPTTVVLRRSSRKRRASKRDGQALAISWPCIFRGALRGRTSA